MASSTEFSKKIMPRSKKFTINFDGKICTFWEYYISLPGDSKVQFGFAVYEVAELEHTMNSLCLYCAAHQFANHGAQTLQLHFHTLVELETLQITTCLLFGVREE